MARHVQATRVNRCKVRSTHLRQFDNVFWVVGLLAQAAPFGDLLGARVGRVPLYAVVQGAHQRRLQQVVLHHLRAQGNNRLIYITGV